MKSPGDCGLWSVGRLWILRFLDHHWNLHKVSDTIMLQLCSPKNQVSHLLKGIMVEHSSKLLVFK